MPYKDINVRREKSNIWRMNHPEYQKIWSEQNKDKIKIYQKRHKSKRKKNYAAYQEKRRIMIPYEANFYAAKTRCSNPKSYRFDRYGGRGILFKITLDDVKEAWFRDKAFLMRRPSLDRADNDGHYEKSNIRFIEQSENVRRANDFYRQKNNKPKEPVNEENNQNARHRAGADDKVPTCK